MAPRLKDRQKQIPYGFKFYQAESKWRAPNNLSLLGISTQLIRHRKGNPALAQKHGWSMEINEVMDEVDEFNAKICLNMGWFDYVNTAAEAQPPPKARPQLEHEEKDIRAAAGRAKKIWSGVKTLNAWLDSGQPAVSSEVSEARAAACAACPQNGAGDFTKWFTKPAAGAIAKQLEVVSSRSLHTKHDREINICEVCLCPLKLKVHTPPQFIKQHLSPELLAELRRVPGCWIPKELSPG